MLVPALLCALRFKRPRRETWVRRSQGPLVPAPGGDALAELGDVNIHAEVVVDGRDRAARLERLCRYIARPPLSLDRLERHHDGCVRVRFKSAWKNGTHAVLLGPLDFISRLCALIPPPRFHMLRYHGVLAGNARERAEVISQHEEEPETTEPQMALFEPGDSTSSSLSAAAHRCVRPAPTDLEKAPMPPRCVQPRGNEGWSVLSTAARGFMAGTSPEQVERSTKLRRGTSYPLRLRMSYPLSRHGIA